MTDKQEQRDAHVVRMVSQSGETAVEAKRACNVNGDGPFECGCCGMTGRGGRLRVGLLIVLAVVVVVLLVHGFVTAG
jgi:hypothetical protein